MKKIACICVICLLALMGSGCATVPYAGYFADRLGDGGDIFTATLGIGAGAKIRVGPIQPALIVARDIVGLQGGQLFANPQGVALGECVFPENGGEFFSFLGAPGLEWMNRPSYGWQVGWVRGWEGPWTTSVSWSFPCIVVSNVPQHNAQIEVAGGFILTGRVGFNPVELLDFVLGWFKIDICSDDPNYKIVKMKRMLEG